MITYLEQESLKRANRDPDQLSYCTGRQYPSTMVMSAFLFPRRKSPILFFQNSKRFEGYKPVGARRCADIFYIKTHFDAECGYR
jgi:hypothetical protein